MIRGNPIITTVILLALVSPWPASAFEADGLQSGMTPGDVSDQLKRSGYVLRYELRQLGDRGANGALSAGAFWEDKTGKPDFSMKVYNMMFCHDKLVRLSYGIDFDADYYSYFVANLKLYGQPSASEAREAQWSGPGGGFLRQITITWTHDGDRIALSFSPEEHTGAGKLKASRGANLSYTIPTECFPNW